MEYHELIEWILGGAVAAVLGLIGVLYRLHSTDISKNKNDIKELDDKTDKRLDDVEKDIVHIKARSND